MKIYLKFLSFIFVLAACSAPHPIEETLSQQATWSVCASEFEYCEFPGMRQVRFGGDGKYVTKTHYASVNCHMENFGNSDPNPGRTKRCEVSSVMQTTTLKNPMPGMGPAAANLVVPVGHPGHAALRVRTTTEQPAPSDGTGAFRVSCDYSHMNFDDPIVYPRKVGAAHLHTYFGNKNANAFSTASSLAASGKSTCVGGIANRSAYWVPTLLDAKGQPLVPASSIFYYKTGYNQIGVQNIKAMPSGLRMIAGDMRSTSAQPNAFWGCLETYIGRLGSIPNASQCGGAGKHIQMTVVFPQCWNNKTLDSADHKSHMAYPIDVGGKTVCPSTHPVAIPEISLNIRYKIPNTGTTGWRLSSDMYSTSKPGGFSAHGDWFDGWNPTIRNMWVKNCDNAARDCHAHLLGKGSDGKYKEIY